MKRFHWGMASLAFLSMAFAPLSGGSLPSTRPPAPITFEQLAKPTFTLKEAGRFQQTEMFRLGYGDVALATQDGHVLVSDEHGPGVHVFDAKGAYKGRIGGSGRGPGEFLGVQGISLYENDSLLVCDNRQLRASIFARQGSNWKYVRSFVYKPTTDDGYHVGKVSKVPGVQGYLASLLVPNMSAANQRPYQDPVLRQFSENGTVLKKTFLQFKDLEVVIERTQTSVSVTDKPFPRKSVIRFGGRGTHHVAPWTDRLHIVKRSAAGDSLGGLMIDLVPRKALPEHLKFSTTGSQDGMSRHMPATHPAMTDFLVSEKGNYWVNLGPLDTKHQVLAAFSPEGRHLGSALIPADMDLQAVSGGKLYGITGRFSNPAVVAYEIVW